MCTSDVCPPETSERHERRLDLGVGEHVREDVPLEVVHADERQPGRHREPLRVRDAHHERADEPGPVRDRDRVESREGSGPSSPSAAPARSQRLVDDADDRLGVLAARDLGHDAAEARVEVDLARDDVGEQLAPAAHDRGGGLVARRLDREDELGLRPLVGDASAGVGARAGRPT